MVVPDESRCIINEQLVYHKRTNSYYGAN